MHKILIMTEFASLLLEWYDINKRDLPWRATKEPYKVWISEIILQQTQVVQGIRYYLKFIDKYPDIVSLANASEDRVLKMWEGLGYYSRARNLHATAKIVVNEHKGVFPSTYKDIIRLKGVGSYTAAAIASICFGLPHAVIDGNVYRFLSRYFGIDTAIDTAQGKREFQLLADKLLDTDRSADYNQGIMEMGATVCKPKLPLCDECPFSGSCMALVNHLIADLPVKAKKVKQRPRYFNYLFARCDDTIYIERREGNDIWKGLYQLPLIESDKALSADSSSAFLGCEAVLINRKKHILSHQIIYAQFYSVAVSQLKRIDEKRFTAIAIDELRELAFPQLIVDFFNERTFLTRE